LGKWGNICGFGLGVLRAGCRKEFACLVVCVLVIDSVLEFEFVACMLGIVSVLSQLELAR
jgi:hypothetical protein